MGPSKIDCTVSFTTETLSALVRRGFLATDSAYGKVRFAAPRHALRFYFSALWPEAEQDEAVLQAEQGPVMALAEVRSAPRKCELR